MRKAFEAWGKAVIIYCLMTLLAFLFSWSLSMPFIDTQVFVLHAVLIGLILDFVDHDRK